jgi:hypothetical protein
MELFYLAESLPDLDYLSTCAAVVGGQVWQLKWRCFGPLYESAGIRLDASDEEQSYEWRCETFSPASRLTGV